MELLEKALSQIEEKKPTVPSPAVQQSKLTGMVAFLSGRRKL